MAVSLLRRGFTLVELMIVIAIIGILAAVLFPQMQSYQARGRDTARLSDIKDISLRLGDYSRTFSTYPSNTDTYATQTSYCWSDIVAYDPDGQAKDKRFSKLGGTGSLQRDPVRSSQGLGLCTQTGSYYYARIDGSKGTYAVIAARMERATTGANWTKALWLNDPAHVEDMLKAQPLDKNTDYTNDDKIFFLITN